MSNLDQFKKDLAKLMATGDRLNMEIRAECHPAEFQKMLKMAKIDDAEGYIKKLPSFAKTYQSWYSEAKAVVRQLLPDRLLDFVSYYEKPKSRKEISYENYKIEDYLQDLRVTREYDKHVIVGPSAAIPRFAQQLAIVKSAESRFASSLYDIRQMVQADLFDSDLDAADALLKNGFCRAAGAMAGVVLEKHLAQVCENHQIKIGKKHPTISDFNDALKAADTIDVPNWRFITHLADIRNLCDHNKTTEPKSDQVRHLLTGVRKLAKTLF